MWSLTLLVVCAGRVFGAVTAWTVRHPEPVRRGLGGDGEPQAVRSRAYSRARRWLGRLYKRRGHRCVMAAGMESLGWLAFGQVSAEPDGGWQTGRGNRRWGATIGVGGGEARKRSHTAGLLVAIRRIVILNTGPGFARADREWARLARRRAG